MQLSFKRGSTRASRAAERQSATGAPRKLAELREGQQGTIERLDLPEDVATRLMELGFLPGSIVTAARSAPGGDPRVFRVDGSEIALRKETAANLILKM